MVANNISINNKEKEMKNHSLSHNVWAFFQIDYILFCILPGIPV